MDNREVHSGEQPGIKAPNTVIERQSLEAKAIFRSACTECQRRKQKCSRYWPCFHCDNRRLGGQCVFPTILDVKSPEERRAQLKQSVTQMKESCYYSHELLDPLDGDSDGSDVDLEGLGYSGSHVASSYSGPRKKRTHTTPDSAKPGHSPHLDKAIQALPSKPCLDALVDNFLDTVNFHYYIVHPAMFRREYQNWCHRAYNNNHVELQWTALLLMACACSTQYSSDSLRRVLEADQGQSIHRLSEKYHAASHKLLMTIPMGRYDINILQTYLHSSLWFRTKARYPEFWRDLRAAIQVASELDMNREEITEEITDTLSDYNLEMRRRAWVTIRAWDWQLGSIISRPLISQPDFCNLKPPEPLLDEELAELDPSPGLFMWLQCELGGALSSAFEKPGPLEEMKDIVQHNSIVENWAARLPPHLSLRNPDTRMDDDYPWLRFQRFNLTMMGTFSLLSPLRSYLTKPLSMDSPAEDLRLQQDGTLWALRHLNRLFQFLRIAFPEDTTYFTVLLFIFDVAVLLCSAVVHDIDSSMPMRELALRAIDGSLCVMRTLEQHASVAKQSYRILNRIYDQFLRPPTTGDTRRRKRQRVDLAQSQVFPNRREEYMPELDEFWDSYDFSFTIPGGNDSHESPTSIDSGVGISVPTGVNIPPGTSPNEILADRPPILPLNADENTNRAYMLSSSVGSSNLGDQSATSAPSDTLMHQITESMPMPVEDSENSNKPDMAHEVGKFAQFSKYANSSIWNRVWGPGQVKPPGLEE